MRVCLGLGCCEQLAARVPPACCARALCCLGPPLWILPHMAYLPVPLGSAAGFCVTIAITDRQSGTLLDEWQIHTSVAASAPSVPPAVSRRRRLRGLLDNDVLSTLRSSARSRAARP